MTFQEWYNEIDELIKDGLKNGYVIYTEDLNVIEGLYETTMLENAALLNEKIIE